MFTNNALPLTPFVKSGKIRAIAVSGETRLRSLPDVPTFTQGGLPGYEVKSWQGILAPAKTPKPIVAKLNSEITRILKTPQMRDRIAQQGGEAIAGSPEELGKLMRDDLKKWAAVAKQAGIKPE